ncbi:hypothetical protein KQI84_05710 [bacterium]|nr:hypothetical protein [bacterium]
MRSSKLWIGVLLLAGLACLGGCSGGNGDPKTYFVRLGEIIRISEVPDSPKVELLSPLKPDVQYRRQFDLEVYDGEWVLVSKTISKTGYAPDGELRMTTRYLLQESPSGLGYDATGSISYVPAYDPWPPDDMLEAIKKNSDGRGELFMMEVHDPKFLDLFTAWREKRFDDANQLAMELVQRHPKDRLFRMAEIDTAMLVGNEVRYDRLITAYVNDFGTTDHPADKLAIESMRRTQEARRLNREGKNLHSAFESNAPNDPNTPSEPIDAVLLRYRTTSRNYSVHNPDECLVLTDGTDIPSFFALLIQTKLACVLSDFAMMQGQVEQPISILKGAWQMGLLFSRDGGYLIHDLIGINIRRLAMRDLQRAFLNATTTSDQIAYFFPVIDDAYRQERALQAQSRAPNWQSTEMNIETLNECDTRGNVAFTLTALTHSATAARQHFLASGQMPERPEDFAPLLPDGPDPDPFDPDGRRLRTRHVPERGNVFAIYSLGPDEADQQATISYDPSNGTVSTGDIFTDIPREREYPFPPPGELETTAPELLKQFPNGLPPDPLRDKSGNSYTILMSDPAWILSGGPDMKMTVGGEFLYPRESQEWKAKYDEWVSSGRPGPEPFYRYEWYPSGDMHNPDDDQKVDGVFTLGRIGEFQFSDIQPGRGVSVYDGQYVVLSDLMSQPYYDPTNGLLSDGNLFFNTADPGVHSFGGNMP